MEDGACSSVRSFASLHFSCPRWYSVACRVGMHVTACTACVIRAHLVLLRSTHLELNLLDPVVEEGDRMLLCMGIEPYFSRMPISHRRRVPYQINRSVEKSIPPTLECTLMQQKIAPNWPGCSRSPRF